MKRLLLLSSLLSGIAVSACTTLGTDSGQDQKNSDAPAYSEETQAAILDAASIFTK